MVTKLYEYQTFSSSLACSPICTLCPCTEDNPAAGKTERLGPATSIVIGTPKRVQEHVERESFSLEQVQFVVLDGADQLFAKKHQEVVENLLDQMPASRQTAVLASRLDNSLQELADQHLFEPVVLKREASNVAMPLIKHRYQTITSGEKTAALTKLLDGENIDRALIYVNLRTDAKLVAQLLQAQGYMAAWLHEGVEVSSADSTVLSGARKASTFWY